MAQLLIIPWYEEGNICTINDPSTCHQISRVLRMRIGDCLFLQDSAGTKRYRGVIEHIHPDTIRLKILEQINPPEMLMSNTGMVIALPNKFEKLELIVQKLSEIGIDKIICRPSHRSLLRDLPEKKYTRLVAIAREATEQSWGRNVPEISFSPLFPSIERAEVLLFDYHEHLLERMPTYDAKTYKKKSVSGNVRGIVGPEGGFTAEEVLLRSSSLDAQISLGSNVLRMETAAIVGGWWMKKMST